MATINDVWEKFRKFSEAYFLVNPEGGVHLELWSYGGGFITETESQTPLGEWDSFNEAVQVIDNLLGEQP